MGEVRAALWWARSERRRRWRSFVALGLLFGATGALVAAFSSGARRTDAAYDRFHAATRGGDAVIATSEAGVEQTDTATIAALPGVDEAAAYGIFNHQVRLAAEPGRDTGILALVPLEAEGLFDSIEVPQLVAGRHVAGGRDDEVVVSTEVRSELGVGIGDVLVLQTQTPVADDPDDYDGPTFRLEVVGIARVPIGLTHFSGTPIVFPGADVLRRHDEIERSYDVVVRLRAGREDVPAVRAALREEFGFDVPVDDLAESTGRLLDGTAFERNGLLLLAAGAGGVGLLVAAQALGRAVDVGEHPVAVLRSLGVRRRARTLALAGPALVTVATSVVVTLAGAVALSPRFPIGLARQIDPDVAVHADWAVLGLTALAVAAVVATAAGVGAWRAAGARAGIARASRPSRASLRRGPGALVGARLPLVADIGARFALAPPDTRSRSPLRPVVLANVLGLLGVTATAMVSAGFDDALSSPARSGQHWEAMYFAEDPSSFADELLARPDVLGVSHADYAEVSSAGTHFPVFSVEPVTGPSGFTVRTGRAPAAADEIVLGVATARQLHVGVGDSIDLTADADRATLRVVGTGLILETDDSAYDEGSWVTPEGMERVGQLSTFGEAAPAVLVHFDEATARGQIELYTSPEQGVLPNQLAAEAQVVTNLRNVRRLPAVEGAFFGLLTLGSVAHLLWTTTRRRRSDLSVLRALGLTRRQTLAAVTWQGVAVTTVGLVLGVPLGAAVGARVWRSMADAVTVVDVGPIPTAFLAIVAPVTLLTGAGLAFATAPWLVRRVRVRPVDVDD